jgi:hypothetical protein
MTKGQKITRRQALLLGLGTFASVNALPIVRNLGYSNGKLLAQTTQIQNRDFTVV